MFRPTETASKNRNGDYTQVHPCRSCQKAFWSKPSWNGVNVKCPHCGTIN